MTPRPFLALGMLAVFSVAGMRMVAARPDDSASVKTTLVKLEKSSWEMARKQDIAAMREFYPDDALCIFSDGFRANKQQILQINSDYKTPRYAIKGDVDVRRVAPDAAVLVYRIDYTIEEKSGKQAEKNVVVSSTYVRREAKWVNVLYQETPAK